MPATPHDFNSSLSLASGDQDLKCQLIKHFGTDQLSPPDKSDLVRSTVDAMTWVIQQARSVYATEPERLVAAISSSGTANALAVWSMSRRDWIIVSEGLMELLRDAADDLGSRLCRAFPEIMQSELMQRLLQRPPLPGGFQTTLGSFLYFAGIAFFTGHEAGHHLAGHDGHYVEGAHAEHTDGAAMQMDEAQLTKQALERHADSIGLRLCRMAMTHLLSRLWAVERFSVQQRGSFQRVLAMLLVAGAITAAVKITPREILWEDLPNRQHPPAAVRILTLYGSMTASIRENFGDLDATSRSWIPLMCLEVALASTIRAGPLNDVYQARLARGGEPAAIRATGIRKALNDARFTKYNAELDAALEAILPHLKPRR